MAVIRKGPNRCCSPQHQKIDGELDEGSAWTSPAENSLNAWRFGMIWYFDTYWYLFWFCSLQRASIRWFSLKPSPSAVSTSSRTSMWVPTIHYKEWKFKLQYTLWTLADNSSAIRTDHRITQGAGRRRLRSLRQFPRPARARRLAQRRGDICGARRPASRRNGSRGHLVGREASSRRRNRMAARRPAPAPESIRGRQRRRDRSDRRRQHPRAVAK